MLSDIKIDRENDLAYILLRPAECPSVARSVCVAEDVVLDLDDDGQLVGIELLNASSRLDLHSVADGTEDLLVGVKEAAALFGVEKSNFVRDYANNPLFPPPIAELASGRFWLRSDVELYLQTHVAHHRTLKPVFDAGDIVALRSDPGVLLPVTEVLLGGPECRYRVFQDNTDAVYYQSQLQPAPAPVSDRKTLTVRELHAHLTSLKILSPSTDSLFSLRSGRVRYVPYQYRPVLKLIRADRPRLLVADEVGVGKTIEAGLVIKELRARADVSSVLVICPKPLVAERKWYMEMKRFDEHFLALDGPLLRHCLRETDLEGEWPRQYAKAILPFSLFNADLIFGPDGKKKKRSLGLLALDPPPRFDLVIVDEAHHLRNAETYLHQGVKYFCDNAQAVLFLTATPVQLGSEDLYTLLSVLRPDIVIDPASFQQMAEPNRDINAAAHHCRVAAPNWNQLARTSLTRAADTPWGDLFLQPSPAYRGLLSLLERNSLEDRDRVAAIQEIEALYTFSPMINRTRRRDIGEFTTRKPKTIKIDFTDAQKRLHDDLLDVIAKILARCHGQQNVKFMMTTIRRQAASCLYGLTPLLTDILLGKLDQVEFMEASDADADVDLRFVDQIRQDIKDVLEQARELDREDPKVSTFVDLLRNKSEMANNKALVFSTFRHTLGYLYTHTRRSGLRVGLVHGDVAEEERADLRRRFALPKDATDAIDVLLSSEVGCEGLDFQFCDLLVNYDLPWNPMRIEQRIGRIDRYGQPSQTVAIVNFVTPGTVDADIYDRCLWRIGVFEHAVGGNEEILGTITRKLHDIVASFDLSAEDRARRLQQVADNSIRRVREEEELESRQAELFGLDVPNRSWREEIEAAESFWLSASALQVAIVTYLAARLGSDRQHVLGEKPLKTLRLGRNARRLLLDDYKRLPRSTEPVARRWERWLKGARPTLPVTLDPQAAVDSPNAELLSVLHPLVRQAARYLEIKSPKRCALTSHCNGLAPGTYRFALYRWSMLGIKPDESLVPVATDPLVEQHVLSLLQSASDADATAPINDSEPDPLDARHYETWAKARAEHVEANRRLVQHRIQSLTVSHCARRKAIEDQIARATDDKIRLMKKSELARTDADADRRMEKLERMANSGDIRATPVVVGTLSLICEGAR